MSQTVGSAERPLRIAIVGAGPSGFFATAALLARKDLEVRVDLIDALAAPYGLVRYGVAPDHQKIKSVTKAFERTATDPRVRFLGNVALGRDLSHAELLAHYDQVLYTVGAQADRRLGVEGEDLDGSFSATEFVAWYNGHPDFADRTFDLSCLAVAIVGVGNVAMDVARILAMPVEELRKTDIADHALAVLANSRVRDIYVLARRGPAQAKFTNPEIREFGEIPGCDPIVAAEELALDPVSAATAAEDKTTGRNVEILREFAARGATGAERRVHFRFAVSPTAVLGDSGRVSGVTLQRNELRPNGQGDVSAVPTDAFEELPVGLIFRSVGYKGVPLAGVPFDARAGVIPNAGGRVIEPSQGGAVRPREYVAGWIKRGPSGVIGTNKPCAVESAEAMLADAAALTGAEAPHATAGPDALLASRGVRVVSFSDWQALDRVEVGAGAAAGRPRVKLVRTSEMLAAL